MMSNKEFAEFLIEKIEEHKHNLCGDKDLTPVTGAYAQAHEHIIELIQLYAEYADVISK